MQEIKEINKVVYLSNNDILPNRFQPRKYFDEEEIMQLSESIKEHGVINPVIVRKLGDKYELVAGERRYKANILAGNDDIPAIIMDVNDKESSEIAVVENIQRKDLNAIEEAISYKRILDIGYMTQEQLAQKMGKSQSSIANKIRLLKLSDEVQDALMKKQISERHARSLLKLESQKKQNELLERIINERLTVRKTDEEIEKMNNNMNNFNNFYNNVPNNNPEQLTPIMPGTNVTDVNISGGNNEQIQNNGITNQVVEPVMPSVTNVERNVNTIPIPPVQSQAEQQFAASQQINNQVEPTQSEGQVIPTVSIDDVLAKANQPSVVGNQSFGDNSYNSNSQVVNNTQMNNSMSLNNNFEIPNLSPINEEPTPITSQNEFSIPDLSPMNESVIGIGNNQSIESTGVSKSKPVELQSNINENSNFGVPNLNPISENPEPIDDFLSSINNNMKLDSLEKSQTETTASMNTFTPFNLNRDDNTINSPINTSPIIDTADVNNQNNIGINNGTVNTDAQSIPEGTQQFERVSEPIIVNEYNDQYAPIMPKQQNQQPTIDFKTIISLIRKCSQAIENSGYKIETEEYNLDNLYQVVFKIEKR